MRLARPLALALLFAGVSLPALAVEPVVGDPGIKSIEAIAFGPDGLLLIGDGKGAQVVAIETGDLKTIQWTKTEIANIKDHLAGRLGTTASGIDILKMAVNPASHKVYIAVKKLQAKQESTDVLDGAGKVSDFQLATVNHKRFALNPGGSSNVP